MENLDNLIENVNANTRFNLAVMDMLALICGTIKEIDQPNALLLSEKLKVLAGIDELNHGESFSILALHLASVIEDPSTLRLQSSLVPPHQLNPEEVKASLNVVPRHEE